MEEQLGGRSSGENDRNQQQQRRMKMPENISSAPGQLPQPPPQKCPRCDSNNTKFCYYNNYSLTQPRYFCKTCRRYWTQGGTLRNVPVGGGCRKGKRTIKGGGGGTGGINISGGSSSSTGEISSRSNHHQVLQSPQIANLSAAFFSGNNSRSQPPPLPSMSSLYANGGAGGGFLSSLAAMQSISQLSHQSQLGVISGSNNSSNNQFGNFNIPTSTPSKIQINQQMESVGFYQKPNMESSFYQSDQTLQFQPTRPLGSWTQRFINNNNIWPNSSTSNSSSGGANDSTTVAGASLSPNQWPDLPGFSPSP